MPRITELSVLLRAAAELPPSLIMKRGEFMDGWNIAQTGGASLLERRIRRRGWHFIRIAEESRQSGVGDSSQEAVACALLGDHRNIVITFRCVADPRDVVQEYREWKMTYSTTPHRCRCNSCISIKDRNTHVHTLLSSCF